MSLGTANRDGGKTSESGHLRALTKGYRAEVLGGLNVSQRAAGANMSVDIAIGDAIIPRSDGTYSHPAFNDAVINQAITTADPSNPRRDIVVLYVDYGQAPSTGVSNNTNGVIKVKVVAGTPAGSPVDPTDTAIQTSVGAGNPFIKLARARIGAGVTSVGNSVIDDLRRMASSHAQGGWLYEYVYTWVYVSALSFKIVGADARAQFPVGTKIQLYQGSVVAYFRVIAAAFSTDTTVTLESDSLYTLSNVPIDRPAFSYDLRPTGYTLAPFSVLNMKSASNAGSVAVINGDNNLGTLAGVQTTFTVEQACQALVTISIGASSTTDFEYQPNILLDGALYKKFQPSAAAGNGSNRASIRGFSFVVAIPAGTHTIAAGVTFASGTSLSLPPLGSSISSMVLGNVTA
jgi:hypothetical protein